MRMYTDQQPQVNEHAAESDDGMPLHEWSIVGDLLQRVTYVGDKENARWGR